MWPDHQEHAAARPHCGSVTLSEYLGHFQGERNHQGKDTLLLFPTGEIHATGPVRCRERLGGLLKFYHRAAA